MKRLSSPRFPQPVVAEVVCRGCPFTPSVASTGVQGMRNAELDGEREEKMTRK
jgi:hypothetical protein